MKTFTPSKENFIQCSTGFLQKRPAMLRWMEIDQVCEMSMDESSQKLYTPSITYKVTYNLSLPSSRLILRSLSSQCSCQLEFLRAQLRKNPILPLPFRSQSGLQKNFLLSVMHYFLMARRRAPFKIQNQLLYCTSFTLPSPTFAPSYTNVQIK